MYHTYYIHIIYMYYTHRDLEKSVSGPEPAVCGSRGVWYDPLNDNVVEISVHTSNHGQPQNLRSLEDGDGFLPTRYNNCTENTCGYLPMNNDNM